MSEPRTLLQEYWNRSSFGITSSPAPEKDIKILEQKYNLQLPEDFRRYLRFSNPEPNNMDKDANYWWPLSELKNIPDEYARVVPNQEIAVDASCYIFFADHLVWSWAWAICCQPGRNYGKIAQIGTGNDLVANSFSEFVVARLRILESDYSITTR